MTIRASRRGSSCARVAFLVLAALAAAGCSPGKGLTIEGTVSYKGKPVSSGFVRFFGSGDHVSMAKIESDGRFIITDVFPGEVKVTVEQDPSPHAIPEKYGDVQTSGLVYPITSATTKLDIKLD
jgi:hypothetical protein